MHLGVLATASHAITTQTLFVVYYKPRYHFFLTSLNFGLLDESCEILASFFTYLPNRTSQFIIGLNKYLEAMQHGFSVGMRFKMRFEGEDSPERRF